MSQTNPFAKAQNPDYVYLDIQQTNVYNNTTTNDIDINFIETRDTPVIANTGDYTVSVTRFQLDTYKLPTLLVEPDLTGTFNPERTIHKVALINTSAQFPVVEPSASINQTQALASGVVSEAFGRTIAVSSNGEFIVVGAPFGNYGGSNGRGKVYIFERSSSTGNYTIQSLINNVFDHTANLQVGRSLAISADGVFILVGTGDIANSHTYYIYRPTLSAFKIPKPANVGNSASNVSINHDGTIMVIGYPTASQGGNDRGIVQILKVSPGNITVVQTINGVSDSAFFGNSVAMNGTGSRIIIGTDPETLINGFVRVYKNDTPLTSDVWTSEIITIPVGIPDYRFGLSTAISQNGLVIAVGTSSATNTGNVLIYKYDVATSLYVFFASLVIPAGSLSYFSATIGLSYDGSEVVLGYPESNSDNGRLITYIEFEGTFVEAGITNGTIASGKLGKSLALWNDGNDFVAGLPGTDGALVYHLSYNLYIPMPDNIKNHTSVEHVMWSPANTSPSLVAPTRASLNGKNTVLTPYYYCNSYARFIGQVNKALGEAYVANFNYIFDNWVTNLTTTQKHIFYNIVSRFYSTPPFLEWSNNSLKASLVANALFNSQESNYAIVERLWNVVGLNAVHLPDPPIPFHFKIAFNASLYALFNSFPALETSINNERFYIMDFAYPVPNIVNITLNAIPLYPNYPFLDPFIGPDGIITLETPLEYGHIGTHIVLEQELSTIDTWCPINGLVFTTNTLPIVINQFSSNTTINGERPNPEAGGDFALVITDLQSNQQGYKPNIIYTPTAEYRRIDMTGNLGLTNIDIRVFWRAKTGQLLPMKLACGVTSSIKLLFQKKLLGEKQQLQFKSLSVKDLKL